jgi:copper(I)-binding protein
MNNNINLDYFKFEGTKMKTLLIFLMLLLQVNAQEKTSDHIYVKNSYIRLMPPMMKMTAAFMKIKNTSSKNVIITSVSSNLSKFTEMHTHILNDQGTAFMSKMEKIEIKANSTYTLEKGGDHIMFIGLQKPLKIGDTHELMLHFNDGTSKEITIEVKKL